MIRNVLITVFVSLCITTLAQEYDAVLKFQNTDIEITNNKLIKNVYYEIEINNRAGDKYTKIQVPYSNLIKLGKIEASIIDSNGKVIKKLKKKDIIEKSSISDFSLYEDDFVKEFSLKHNSYPYTISYSYQTQQDEFLYIDYWIPIIDEKTPTLSANLKITVPSDYLISFKNRLVADPMINTDDNTTQYQWNASYNNIIKDEIYSPPISNFFPSVRVIPIEFYYDINGSFKDWNTFGNWQHELLQGLNELPDFEKIKISTLIEDVENNKEKIKILYHYLQDETRYINVKIETGGLKPYPASYVAQNKFGDCKALTNYFKSVLDYVQIPSFYTKVYAGNPISVIDQDFPSQQTNHIILFIPLENEKIWLDCTSDGAFNYLGTFTQNRNAFMISKDSSRFIKTPALLPEEVLEIRKIETKFNTQNAKIKAMNTYKGEAYESILHLEKNYNEKEKSRIIRNYIVEDGFQLVDYIISHPGRDSAKIIFSYNATSSDIYKSYGNDLLLNNIAFSLPHFSKPQERELPVQIDYPIYKIDTLIYEIPTNYKLNKSNISYEVNNKYGSYKINIYESDGNVFTAKSLLIHAGNYSLSDYPDFYNFYKQIIELENQTHISLFK